MYDLSSSRQIKWFQSIYSDSENGESNKNMEQINLKETNIKVNIWMTKTMQKSFHLSI